MQNNKTGFIRGNKNLKTPNYTEYISKEEAIIRTKEIIRCKNDILYFAEKYFTIISPGKGKHIIQMYDRQKDMLLMMKNNDRSIFACSRQIGKTTTYTILVLWNMLFNKDWKALICANKASASLEFVGRIRLAYELLPQWMKPGVLTWNKSSLELSNGCKVKGIATSPDSARGETCNMLLMDECLTKNNLITIRDKYSKKILILNIDKVYNRLLTEVKVKNARFKPNSKYQILTPDGFCDFNGIKKSKSNKIIKFELEDNNTVECTTTHTMYINGVKTKAVNLNIGDKIDTIDKINKSIISKHITAKDVFVYTPINVKSKGNKYIANNSVHKNCAFVPQNIFDEFIQSVFPIISSAKGTQMILVSTPNGTGNFFYETFNKSQLNKDYEWKSMKILWDEFPGRDEEWKLQQIETFGGGETGLRKFAQEFEVRFFGSGASLIDSDVINFYKNKFISEYPTTENINFNSNNTRFDLKVLTPPVDGHTYACGIDTGEGLGGDSSVITILDITDMTKLSIVAYYGNNYIIPYDFAYMVVKSAGYYNNAYIIGECNSVGNEVISQLYNVYEYENIIHYNPGKSNRLIGLYSINSIKVEACQYLKKMLVKNEEYSFDCPGLLEELEYFVRKPGNSTKVIYKADGTKHDDYVLAFVWALFVTNPKISDNYFDVTYTKDKLGNPIPYKITAIQSEYYEERPTRSTNPEDVYHNGFDTSSGSAKEFDEMFFDVKTSMDMLEEYNTNNTFMSSSPDIFGTLGS